MNPIGAGTLGRRIKIQRPSTVKDSLGAPSRTWIDVATVWADTPGNDKLAESFRRIEEAARQAADGATLLGQRALELSDPGAGFSKALRTLGEETEQVGKQMEAVTTKAFNGMTDALTNFVMTGNFIDERRDASIDQVAKDVKELL